MITQYHLYKSMFPILAVILLVSACSPAINWDYPRTPSNTFAHPQTTYRRRAVSGSGRQTPGTIRLLDYSRRRSRRLWLGWRWPT